MKRNALTMIIGALVLTLFACCGIGVEEPAVFSEALAPPLIVEQRDEMAESEEEPATEPEARYPEIYRESAQRKDPYFSTNTMIAIDKDSAWIIESPDYMVYGAHNGYLFAKTLPDSQYIQTYYLPSGEIAESKIWPGHTNLHLFSNGVLALTGYYQDQLKEPIGQYRPLLLDNQCAPLEMEFQFDYGKTDENGAGDEYWIVDLAYRVENDTYIALYSRNPYVGHTLDGNLHYTEMFDNRECRLGIAIFTGDGQQIDRFVMEDVLHPFNFAQIKSPLLPRLYLIGPDTVLITPLAAEGATYATATSNALLEGYSSQPILVETGAREWRRLSNEEMQVLLDEHTELTGVLDTSLGYWVVEETLAHPLTLEWQGDDLLVYRNMDDTLPLFALPDFDERYHRLKCYHEYLGIEYLIFY